MTNEEIKMKCLHCKSCREIGINIYTGEKVFLCYNRQPYGGKWVGEIEKCPKEVNNDGKGSSKKSD